MWQNVEGVVVQAVMELCGVWAGEHSVSVLYGGAAVTGSPYTVLVQAPKVYVQDLPTMAYLHESTTFTSTYFQHSIISASLGRPLHIKH